VNIDGGAAADPETGLLYVASQTGLSTTEIGKDPCSELRYTQASGDSPRDSCGKLGAPAAPAGYTPRGGGAGRGGAAAAAGGGRAGGAGAAGAGGGAGRGAGPTGSGYKDASPGTTTIAGISILKPRELGGITAYNMNTGDKAWWIPNGGRLVAPTVNQNSPDAALFANVKLPMVPARGQQGQVINTRSLVIYGTGRTGAPGEDGTSKLFAVDKATGKQVGAVTIPRNSSAVPMTFLYQGRQYIVVAIGGAQNPAELVALVLPAK
jgi:quinoprotein glucose dehydrogenase